ncbi:unnamed protein product [Rhizophagus irregularis]|nr:unnamed protein product [Rhizophagus irregularis]
MMNQSSVQTEIFPPENIKNILLYPKYTKRNTTIMIYCFVVGTYLSNAFEIECLTEMSISKLRHVIYKMNKKSFNNFDSNKLILWKVDIPGDTNDVKMKTLQNRSRIDKERSIIKELGGIELTPFDDVGDIFKCSSKNICIIVQPPATITNQGITDYITESGYLPRLSGLGGTLLRLDMKVGSTNEGVNLSGRDRQLISLRFDIIKSLINELKYKKVILVQAPPFSGKTSTAQIWRKPCWEEWTDQCRLIPSILIVDEAHLIYGKDKEVSNKESADKESADQFWATVKSLLQEVSDLNIIMFAAYGYRSSNYAGLATPVKLPETNCKTRRLRIIQIYPKGNRRICGFSSPHFGSIENGLKNKDDEPNWKIIFRVM